MIFANAIYCAAAAALVAGAAGAAPAEVSEEQLQLEARRQAKSVHLWYAAEDGKFPETQEVSLEMTVRESAPGSYFCAVSFEGGYLGIQELQDGKRVAIFSVWDTDDPYDHTAHEGNVPEEERTRVVKLGDGVALKRFSGEGTGAQAMVAFPWKVGEKYAFKVRAAKDGEHHVAFTGSIDGFEMATFSTRGAGNKAQVRGVYSFVEDFFRNFESARRVRRAEFTCVRAGDKPLVLAGFSGDRNPATNIDAGVVPGGFFLQTGGETQNTHAPLRSRIHMNN